MPTEVEDEVWDRVNKTLEDSESKHRFRIEVTHGKLRHFNSATGQVELSPATSVDIYINDGNLHIAGFDSRASDRGVFDLVDVMNTTATTLKKNGMPLSDTTYLDLSNFVTENLTEAARAEAQQAFNRLGPRGEKKLIT